ncbi:hypothetical protein BC830DRAFT_489666 [Chytriomyces sp. MP71]|nr:hypothetical protein BC830DRAFT_489666 [Chytriomyces sp. MP71]
MSATPAEAAAAAGLPQTAADAQIVTLQGGRPAPLHAPASPTQQSKKRASFLSGVFGKPGPDMRGIKFSAEELKRMAEEAMRGEGSGTGVASPVIAKSPVLEEGSPVTSVEKKDMDAGGAAGISVLEGTSVEAKVEGKADETTNLAGTDSTTSVIEEVVEPRCPTPEDPNAPMVVNELEESPLSPQWEFNGDLDMIEDTELGDAEDAEEPEEDITDFHRRESIVQQVHEEAAAAAAAALEQDVPALSVNANSPTDDTDSAPQPPPTSDSPLPPPPPPPKPAAIPPAPKVDQLAASLERGIDAQGRFLPNSDFTGWYRVQYPYMDNLRSDEIKLRVGDVVRVGVSYVDGWAKARNETLSEEGFVPLHCLVPERNAAVEEGRTLGRWFGACVSHAAELPNDFKFLCHHETRYKLVKGLGE